MADIKQAAKWMKQGTNVRRRAWYGHTLRDYPALAPPLQHDFPLSIDDILADDWEIAPQGKTKAGGK